MLLDFFRKLRRTKNKDKTKIMRDLIDTYSYLSVLFKYSFNYLSASLCALLSDYRIAVTQIWMYRLPSMVK